MMKIEIAWTLSLGFFSSGICEYRWKEKSFAAEEWPETSGTTTMIARGIHSLSFLLDYYISRFWVLYNVQCGGKAEGDQGAAIHIVLIDANNGHVVTSGLESSAKLDILVLEGDFNNEDDDDWDEEEFESHVVKERDGKRPLLTGDLQVSLKEGVGTIGELIFTDNSSWIRSRKFRLGLKIASGSCEVYKKHYPPALKDEVWRLEKIGKDGAFHKKLNTAAIHSVEDFLRLFVRDPQRLRNILGSSMSNKMLDILVEHAKTCALSGKYYIYYSEETRNVGAIFNNIYEFAGLIANGQFFSVESLNENQKFLVSNANYNTFHDCYEFLNLSTIRDIIHTLASIPNFNWGSVNTLLRETSAPYHDSATNTLVRDARTIQYILHTSIIPKDGDQIHVTPIRSLTTYYIMAHRDFNATDLLIHYIEHLTSIRDPDHKRMPYLALGYIIAYVLKSKYNLQYPAPLDHFLIFYSNSSFCILHSTHRYPMHKEVGAEEEGPIPAPIPIH
ncbi:hypothetical protein IEQ34_000087 [Dendrobium chrysotoxum]|uniref:Uncharacterized protein n=1 Tax=Dendrobium chrysotoxum TaxID=161865 RepID=A0AAV7HQ28_DENCH|nr:hypothetical protein IEQ34_000087 [Dendrobium chrysotoxum]